LTKVKVLSSQFSNQRVREVEVNKLGSSEACVEMQADMMAWKRHTTGIHDK
jgi:hypothetical protein